MIDESILFGSYPQKLVKDKAITSELGGFEQASWKSFDFYAQNMPQVYGFYKDVYLSGKKYRGVYFTLYRPRNVAFPCSKNTSFQSANGYKTKVVYWFEYQPINWDVFACSDNRKILVSKLILDCVHFACELKNNYNSSYISKWLNSDFINVAFNEVEQNRLIETIVDNSLTSTTNDYNKYLCQDSKQKVWLMSQKDVATLYPKLCSAKKTACDYAKALGLLDMGGSMYWLRTPNCSAESLCEIINYSGFNIALDANEVHGVVPAIIL